MYGCSRAVLEIFMPETLLGADFRCVELSEAEGAPRQRVAAQGLQWSARQRDHALSAQAEPLLPPPTLLLPWTSDAVNWMEVAAHLSNASELPLVAPTYTCQHCALAQAQRSAAL